MNDYPELNDRQREAVLHFTSPLLILAGAGSGKTRVLTLKIAHLLKEGYVFPSEVLAMTFSNKAGEEMARRIETFVEGSAKYIWMGTFHAIGSRILRQQGEKLGMKANFTIIDDQGQHQLVKRLLKERNISEQQLPAKMLQYAINKYKNEALLPDDISLTNPNSTERKIIECYQHYQERLIVNNSFDFGDLILKPIQLFRRFPEVLEQYRLRFRAIYIDEYQDTNHAQFLFFHTLAKEKTHVAVVGDDDQSIYGWRGADINNILDYPKYFPDSKVVILERNYRSTKPILGAASRVIRQNKRRYEKNLYTELDSSREISVNGCNNDRDECRTLIQEIIGQKRERNLKFNDFAVFYRTNAQSRIIEEEFLRNHIPYKIIGGNKFFERMEIRDLLAYLKLILNQDDDSSFERIINTPGRGIGKTTLASIQDEASQRSISCMGILHALRDQDISFGSKTGVLVEFLSMIESFIRSVERGFSKQLLLDLVAKIDYRDYLHSTHGIEAENRIENIDEFINSYMEYFEHNRSATLSGYLESVALHSDTDDHDYSQERVVLMTVHCSKGLEFDSVFIIGLEDGLFPHARSKSERELEEERRLCYVGMTRAKNNLYLSYCRSRRFNGFSRRVFPSPFLKDIKNINNMNKLTETGSYEYNGRTSAEVEYEVVGDDIDLAPGMKVHHPIFGTGKLQKVEGERHDLRLTVYFVGFGLKKISPKVMPVKIIQ